MGCFSWLFCDSLRKGEYRSLRHGMEAYVPFPKHRSALGIPAGSILYEPSYDCYGRFGGLDIYEIVAEWNKGFINDLSLNKPIREEWMPDEEGERFFQAAVERYKNALNRVHDFQSGKSDDYMVSTYGKEWKRELGISIACYDWQNNSLRYPIKICKKRSSVYEALPASKRDPNQGIF